MVPLDRQAIENSYDKNLPDEELSMPLHPGRFFSTKCKEHQCRVEAETSLTLFSYLEEGGSVKIELTVTIRYGNGCNNDNNSNDNTNHNIKGYSFPDFFKFALLEADKRTTMRW